ncbi:MAG: helix-turn-helix transcriptional regulator [Planctomycetaceae bacterium]|jgi:transcriptional regulator with XRE-family HTH domain|nr:helix-turn-helix transcriptional regulator [Planctomycetaceae bacterium]MBT6157996.1 helix-turn-helix transcriptional regulator [Planctomycetaceae bacterium]MBT6484793.1 helix-turn-helix transcriptional regulator [Planctomycetaceae bacterium]MBT6494110.1 helix-turn-helix transcriptional regulator [Planctomycetaceae bacterium]
MDDHAQQPRHSGESIWQRRIREECLRRGWDIGELARRTGMTRGTLYNLRRGTTRRPRASTLNSIARAFDIDPCSLDRQTDEPVGGENIPQFDSPALDSAGFDSRVQTGSDRRFDRQTNPLVDVVRQNAPELFSGWNEADFDELFSVFGTGGGLTEEGVTKAAMQMNRRRETLWRLQIVMETHLAEVAERLVKTLFEMTRPQGNLAETPQPDELIAGIRSSPDVAVADVP